MAEEALTPYRILVSHDEGKTADIIGETVAARSSEHALRQFYGTPPLDEAAADDAWYAAVSVNSFKWRELSARVLTSIREVGNEPEPEPEPVAPVDEVLGTA